MSCFGQPCFPIIRRVGGISIYKADASTDIYSAVQYLEEGHEWWSYLTIFFTLLPTLITAVLICYRMITIKKYRRALLIIICFPVVSLGSLYWDLIQTIKGTTARDSNTNGDANDNTSNDHDNVTDNTSNTNDGAADNTSNASSEMADHVVFASAAKFSDSITESLPQASIAMHIIFQTLLRHGLVAVDTYQWVTLTVSLVALAFSIATNDWLDEASAMAKLAIFFASLLGITSRLMVCSTYSAMHPGYWFIPSGTELAAWVIIWIIKRYTVKSPSVDLALAVTSSVYVLYGIGGLFVALPKAVTVTSLVMSIILVPMQIGWWWYMDKYV